MCSPDFQHYLTLTVVPFIAQKSNFLNVKIEISTIAIDLFLILFLTNINVLHEN